VLCHSPSEDTLLGIEGDPAAHLEEATVPVEEAVLMHT
jgi:hypothetical protein